MADNEATLIYRGEYDNSKLLSAMEVQDQAFIESGKTAEKAFGQISNADSQAATIAKTSAAMRRDLQEENAAVAIKTAEREAEAIASAKAKAEREYLRVEAQAAAAEAQAGASRVTRAIERENAFHQTRLQALIGNDEAQESEARRHAAVMTTLQADVSARAVAASQQMIGRLGSIGNQVQGIQNAFMGVAIASGDLDSKFGQMIGRMGLLASGGMGVAQAYEAIAASEIAMGRAMLIGLPILAAAGVALAVILNHQEKLKELAKHNDWLGDPTKAAAVAAAMDQAAAGTASMNAETTAAVAAYGAMAGQMASVTKGAKEYADANAKIQAITGLTRDEIIKLYGDLDRARYAFQQLADERLVNQQFALERALIGAKKDGADKAVELQEVANRQAEQSIKNHYAAVLVDTKKSEEDKKRAIAQMGKELALQEEINQALIEQVRATYANKAEKKSDTKAAEQVKEYHRMSVEAAKAADEAIAALDENKYNRAIGKIDAEWTATKKLYDEKKTAAAGNTKALAELDQWYASQTEMYEARAATAYNEGQALKLKDYGDYQKQILTLDAQIRDSQIQATGDAFAAQRQQVLDAEEAANLQAETARERWTKELGDKAKADEMANALIERNHKLSADRIALIDKQATEKATQMRLQAVSGAIAAGEQFLTAAGIQNKALFALSKAAAAANVFVMGQMAIAQVHANTPPQAWPFLDGMAITATALQEAAIAATVMKGFQGGGWTPEGPEDGVAGFVHNRERVISARETAQAGGRAAMEARIQGSGGGDTFHMGDTYVTMPVGATPEQGEAVGRAIAQGKIAELRTLRRNLRLMNDLRISE